MPLHPDLESLCSAAQSGARLKYLFFWGHTAAHPSAIEKECLSQWYPASSVADRLQFANAEQYMMFGKARLFDDPEAADRILRAPNPGAVKAIGRTVRGFQEPMWQQHRFPIAVDGNFAKFSQSEPLRAFLLNTKQRILVEASPVDRIWGIGLAVDDPHHENPLEWRGLNLLGFALMAVRERLR